MKSRGLPPIEEQYALLLEGVLSEDEVDDELVHLASLLQPLRETPLARPDPAFRADLRQRLEQAATAPGTLQRVRDAVWDRTARWRYSLRVATASAMAASMLGTAGVAAAAQFALPGELLYPVKQATETVRMALAGDLEAVGRLHLGFAEERLEEVTEGATSLRSDLLVDALADMDGSGLRGSDDLLAVFAIGSDDEVLELLGAFLDRQHDGIEAVIEQLPIDVRPFAEASLDVLAGIQRRVEAAACGCDPDGSGPLPVPRAPAAVGGGTAPPGSGGSSSGGSSSGDAPTDCDCVPPQQPRPPREPSTPPRDEPNDPAPGDPAPTEPPRDEPEEPEEPPRDDRIVVPELPGPLDPIGETIDGVIGGLLDTTGTPPPVDGPPVEELSPPALTEDTLIGGTDDVVDGLTGLLAD